MDREHGAAPVREAGAQFDQRRQVPYGAGCCNQHHADGEYCKVRGPADQEPGNGVKHQTAAEQESPALGNIVGEQAAGKRDQTGGDFPDGDKGTDLDRGNAKCLLDGRQQDGKALGQEVKNRMAEEKAEQQRQVFLHFRASTVNASRISSREPSVS